MPRTAEHHAAPRLVPLVACAVAVGLAVGALTACAQGWLGDSVSSLANSAGPWSLAAFVIAWFARRLPVAIAGAVATLLCCELGYALATELRGGSNASATVAFWLAAGVLAGPPLGVAGAWAAGSGRRSGAGFGVIGGVLVGEGVYGWTTVADTTDWRYWMGEVVVGAVLVVAAGRRGRSLTTVAVTLAVAFATAVVVFGAARLA